MRLSHQSELAGLRKIFAPLDGAMILILVLIAALSIVAMYSASSDIPERFPDHIRNLGIGFVVMLAFAYIPPQWLMKAAVPLYVIGVVLLIAVALFGQTKLGAKRWLNVGIVIQPSELLKIAVPLMLSYYFHLTGIVSGRQAWFSFGLAGVLLLIPFLLIAKQPDLGTALLVVFAGSYVIFFAGLSWKVIWGLIGTVVFSFPIIWQFLKPYQRTRIEVLLDPTSDPRGAGFHILQAETAIGSGGWLGKGFEQGTQTHLKFLPERSTDFLVAVLSEEFGLIGVILLLVLYLMLIFRGLSIAHGASTRFERLLASAITMIIFTYAFVNMGMVAGMLPVVGVPLPFMSYGGTALITLGVGCGMLMGVRHHRIR
ncbi:rod shape-determining protein RodA [Hydromonas duriensis]|uniref:Peptidoglycan glycosyltransferase MrdB n=1 Tax=Hydromonas duriensis TaxID=1527608 RepID=A0A4R6YBE6_9BURK|nr:rod shape-determining protein RodA [Hydromonas duriensis]TDR32974.1 cell elongation-specific peptidoglycan biosynthesis regulator RodA [Hydromonas duriensis]